MLLKRNKISLIICLCFLSVLGCKTHSNMLNKAKLVWHPPTIAEYKKNITQKLDWVKKEFPDSLSEKKYIVSGLEHQLSSDFFPSNPKDSSAYEKQIIELLEGVDSIKGLKKVVIIGECFSGEAFTCLKYVFFLTKKGCYCNYKNSYKYFYNKPCDMELLNNFLIYMKNRNPIPNKKYFQEFDAENTFRLYVITKDSIYANRFYTTSEYVTLDRLTGQW